METKNESPLGTDFSIACWLADLRLPQHAARLIENEITATNLLELEEADLVQCGIKSPAERKTILDAINRLKSASEWRLSKLEQLRATKRQVTLQHLSKGQAPSASQHSSIKAPPGATIPAAAGPNQSAPGARMPLPPAANILAQPSSGNDKEAKPATTKLKPSLLDRFGGRFLYISVVAHILFGLIAAYFVVQRFEAKRKLTFQAGSKGPSPGAKTMEHKVQVAKKKNTMSAPAQSRRIVTTAVSARVALPDVPMPMAPTMVNSRMTGSTGPASNLSSMGLGGGGGGGGSMPFFGLPRKGVGLQGSFYDLKQSKDRQPTAIKNVPLFVKELNKFVMGNWNEKILADYFKAPQQLCATQIFVPRIKSEIAPKEFGVDKFCKPSLWFALYKGKVSPPETGTYHFVGGGDNILIVRLNGKVVLDRSWTYQKNFGLDKGWAPVGNYDYGFGKIPGGFAKGLPVQLSSTQFYDMEIIVGDDGGVTNFSLLVEKQGVNYQKTDKGLPILPVFRLSNDKEPPGEHPPFQPNGPIWRAQGTGFNSFFAPH